MSTSVPLPKLLAGHAGSLSRVLKLKNLEMSPFLPRRLATDPFRVRQDAFGCKEHGATPSSMKAELAVSPGRAALGQRHRGPGLVLDCYSGHLTTQLCS